MALASWANLFLRYILWWNTDFIRCCYYCSSLSGGKKVRHYHCMPCTTKHFMVWFMVFNTTFNTTHDINYILNAKCSFTIDPLFAFLTLLIFVSLVVARVEYWKRLSPVTRPSVNFLKNLLI